MDRERSFLPERGSRIRPMRSIEEYVPAPSPYIPDADAPSDWQKYVTSVVRHRKVVLLITLLGTAAGVLATRFLEPRYGATSVLWIDKPEPQDTRDLVPAATVVDATAWEELVGSNAVLDSVVRARKLYLRPVTGPGMEVFEDFEITDELQPGHYRLGVDGSGERFVLARVDGPVVQRGAVGDPVGAPAGFRWVPTTGTLEPGGSIEFMIVTPHAAARQLAGELDVGLDPSANFLTIRLEGTDPAATADIVNAVANRVVGVAADLKTSKYHEVTEILREQFAHAQEALIQAEEALRDFRNRTAGQLGTYAPAISSDPRTATDPIITRSIELQVDREEVQRDRRAIETVLEAAPQAGLSIGALNAIGAVQQSPELVFALDEATKKQAELRALRTRYTDESEPVRRLTSELDSLENRAIPSLARRLAQDLRVREDVLAPRVDSAFSAFRQVPSLALEQARLERDVASTEELFTNIRQRYDATRLALLSSLPDIRILDPAVAPQNPTRNLAPLLIVLSFITSLGLSVFGVRLVDRVDPKVRYPEQITRGMRLDILGVVPHVGTRSFRPGDASAEVIEALRALRMRVLHAHGTEEPLLLTITSPAAGEGKSFISMNLALSFAYAGYETLLIDGDVRRGVLHRVLDLPRRPGLTDVLAGRLEIDDAIRATAYNGLSFVSAGTWMQRAPELLLSSRLRELLGRLRDRYPIVIVDSPPLTAGSDPLVIGTATGSLMVVLRSGTTDLALAEAKLGVLDSLPIRVIGAVLNEVRNGDAFRYYTYNLAGYEQVDEENLPGHDDPLRILGGRP